MVDRGKGVVALVGGCDERQGRASDSERVKCTGMEGRRRVPLTSNSVVEGLSLWLRSDLDLDAAKSPRSFTRTREPKHGTCP